MITKRFGKDAVGWYGAVAILSGYAMVSFGLVVANSTGFQLLNISGAMSLAYISYDKRIYSMVALNIVWVVVGLVTLWNIWL